jgi:hypothetical protein
MRIHALTTGTVRLKHAFLFARQNLRRQLDLFLPGPWSEPMPIHCWAIEHAGGLTLVDTGETAVVRDVPSARFGVAAHQELPAALAAARPRHRRRAERGAHPHARRPHGRRRPPQ